MTRNHDAHKDELEGVAQRLRSERPEADPLTLDRIKMTAMSRAKAATGRVGARRLATAGLTVGLLAAGTVGGIAATGPSHPATSAAVAQYGGSCDTNNNNGNNVGNGVGSENNNNNNNFNCNEDSFNNSGNTTTINNTTINESTVTVSAAPQTAGSGVQGSKTSKAKTSGRHIKIHLRLARNSHLRRVTLKIDGKTVRVLRGKQASANINLVNLPCTSGATTVTIIAVTSSGKTIKESHTYHLCQV
jgi:hypothetical protein